MDKSCEVCLDEMEHEEHDFDCDHSCHGKRTMDKTTLQPAVIDGIRLERWINAPHEDGRFRLAGVLLPVRLMKDPLSTSILTEIENRVNSYSATQAALKALVEAAEIVLANATVIPDPAMKGSTDTYSVPLDDIEALKKALALAQEVLK